MKGDIMKPEKEMPPMVVTDLDAIKDNMEEAVYAFTDRWIPVPSFGMNVEVMDQARLRDAMGLRATFESGDPWPAAEKLLLARGFCWHWLGDQRVMYLQEKEDFHPNDGWVEFEELRVEG